MFVSQPQSGWFQDQISAPVIFGGSDEALGHRGWLGDLGAWGCQVLVPGWCCGFNFFSTWVQMKFPWSGAQHGSQGRVSTFWLGEKNLFCDSHISHTFHRWTSESNVGISTEFVKNHKKCQSRWACVEWKPQKIEHGGNWVQMVVSNYWKCCMGVAL